MRNLNCLMWILIVVLLFGCHNIQLCYWKWGNIPSTSNHRSYRSHFPCPNQIGWDDEWFLCVNLWIHDKSYSISWEPNRGDSWLHVFLMIHNIDFCEWSLHFHISQRIYSKHQSKIIVSSIIPLRLKWAQFQDQKIRS